MPYTAEPNEVAPAGAWATAIPHALIRSELARITRSKSFQQSRRHRQLLMHLVEQMVAGNVNALKEPLLAIEVFERPLDGFDPARDTIVRVEARRLRQRLERYYEEEGSDAALEIRLPVGSYVPTLRRREAIPEALTRHAKDLVERGEYFLRQPLSQASLEEALARFDAALRESPDFASAHVGLARAWFNLATGWYRAPRPASEHAAEALRRALRLNADDAIAHALLGAIQHQFEYDWPAAEASFEHACALAPQQSFVHSAYGAHLVAHGDFDVAKRELELARRLDPHYVNARVHMVNLRIAQGRLDHARAELEGMSDIAPMSMPAAGLAGLLALLRGDAEEAIGHYQRACSLAPEHPNAHASLAAALGAAGRIGEADGILATLKERFGLEGTSPYVLGVVAVRCERIDVAFEHLANAIDIRDPSVMLLATDPSFAVLHADTRWPALLGRIRPDRD